MNKIKNDEWEDCLKLLRQRDHLNFKDLQDNDFIIHMACKRNCPPKILSILIDMFPEQLKQSYENDETTLVGTPLVICLFIHSTYKFGFYDTSTYQKEWLHRKITILLEAEPSAIFWRNKSNQSCLDMAIEHELLDLMKFIMNIKVNFHGKEKEFNKMEGLPDIYQYSCLTGAPTPFARSCRKENSAMMVFF